MMRNSFDYYIRSTTTAIIACAIVGAALYNSLTATTQNTFLIGSGGIVIGFYFGAHAALNGNAKVPPPPPVAPEHSE